MSVTEEIKARLDLVAYISESVPLKKAGRNFNARCPFHQERTPSFVVFPETQTWRCFGACAEGGDIFAFAMKQNGWDFKEALEHLAQRAGVDLEPRTPEQSQQEAAFQRMLGLLDETAQFYHRLLQEAPEAQLARTYVAGRSLTDRTVDDFQLGYAPDGWQHTLNHLTDLGYAEADIVAAGVAIRNDRGRVYDRFRHRLVIPIRDGRGRVIGFGARALRDEDKPKYLNSPQSDLFDKSKTLFGLDRARREIRESETAIIVEGYMDVMQAHQAGYRNVVAQMGTALTEPQLQVLRKYADRLIMALDADQAGVAATMRGLNVARQSLNDMNTAVFGRDGSMRQAGRLGIDMRVLVITSGKDPDDLIREHPGEWQKLVDEAEPVADYVIRVGVASLDAARATVHEKEKLARELLPLLTATESDLQRDANVQKLAYRLHLPEKRLMEIARETRLAVSRRIPTNTQMQQRRPTQAMQQAVRSWRKPRPPVTDSRPAPPPPPEDDDAAEVLDVLPPSAPEQLSGWEEGPRPSFDALPVPKETDDAPDLFGADTLPEDAPPVPGGMAAPAAVRAQPASASPQDRYLLGMLLRRPELLYQANRALREVSETAKGVFADDARTVKLHQALNRLSREDFHDTDHQVIFAATVESLEQDALDPLDYIRAAVGPALGPLVDDLLGQGSPVEVVLPESSYRELRSIHKEMRKQGRVLMEPESELVEKVFALRQARLREDVDALRFMAMEASAVDQRAYQDIIDANNAAVAFLDKALQERQQI